jgi:hypothetical protein
MLKTFSSLSERGQVRRLVHKALDAYVVPITTITPLKQVYNKNFRLTTPSDEQYMLGYVIHAGPPWKRCNLSSSGWLPLNRKQTCMFLSLC